ncbi:GumC family protein [Parafilimonas sp.]|uniref:GumC family protein n=1 Tax=Parafilimonas sp. TaxID=1969739 RepID=UPI0039E35707
MDFVYLLRVLLKRKWIIAGSAILAAVIAWYFTKDQPLAYRSISQVSTGFTTNDVVSVNGENNFFEADTKFNNAVVTFTSPTVMSLLSYSVILHDLENPSQAFRKLTDEQKQSDVYKAVDINQAKQVFNDKLNSMSVLTSYKPEEKKLLGFLKLYGYDYGSLASELHVYRLDRTDYIQIDYSSENPELSAFMVNNAYKDFVRYYKFIRTERTSESIDTLQSLLERKRQDRSEANQKIASTGLINIDDANKSNFDLISGLQKTLEEEQDKLATSQIALKSVSQKLSAAGTPVTAVDNSEVVKLRDQKNAAYQEYLNSGSTDQDALNRYNNLNAQYQSKIKSVGLATGSSSSSIDKAALQQRKSDLEDGIEASKLRIASLQAKIDQLQGSVSSAATRSAEAQSLSKDADLSDKEYLDILQKYNTAVDQSNASVNSFHQILVGQPAIEPEPSKRFLIVGMAGVAVMVCSILIIIFLTYLDSSVKTPSVFSRVVNLKLLSLVNFTSLKNKDIAQVVANTSAVKDSLEKNRENKFRESLRKLRYEIENSGKKVFLFTSTKKGQGKTTLIQALSYSLSLSKKKVLIVDTNFCNNDLTVQLNGTPVLEKIIADDADDKLIEEIQNASVDVRTGMIYLIGCSGGDYTPSEILPAKNLLQHLQKLTTVYDYIFLEGPPLNDFSDSKELTQYVDGIVAIFSARHVIKQIDKESIKFFKNLNGKFCGAVLNMVQLETLNDA